MITSPALRPALEAGDSNETESTVALIKGFNGLYCPLLNILSPKSSGIFILLVIPSDLETVTYSTGLSNKFLFISKTFST